MEQALEVIILVILVGFGGYAVYTGIQLKRRGYLFDNRILYPGNCKKEDCTDEYGFVDFMTPRMFICGGLSLVLGIFSGLVFFADKLPEGMKKVFALPAWFTTYVLPFLGLGIFVWYIIIQTKASKRFW